MSVKNSRSSQSQLSDLGTWLFENVNHNHFDKLATRIS